jgi:hypothetical protein
MQAELVTIVFGEVLSKVPIFELLRAEDENFLMEVWTFMKCKSCSAGVGALGRVYRYGYITRNPNPELTRARVCESL